MKLQDYNCGDLLDELRPEVQRILLELGEVQPPSQSSRAHNAIRKIIETSDNPTTPMEERFKLNRLKWRLEKFLAVWETVNIFERRMHDTERKLDAFGLEKQQP